MLACKFKTRAWSLLIFSVLLGACNNNGIELSYRGMIDQNFIGLLHELDSDSYELTFASPGGVSNFGIEAAELISNKNFHIIVDGQFGICASGCAEYIITSAKNTSFRNEPLVGFHRNPHIIYSILENQSQLDLKYCDFIRSELLATETLYDRNGINKNFWKLTKSKIQESYKSITEYPEKCPGMTVGFKNELWFPTTKQLSENLGLRFKGRVCADSYDTCSRKIDKIWPEGTRMIIGDKLYISKGK